MCSDLFPGIVRFSESRSASALGWTRFSLDIGAVLDQELNRGSVAFVGGPHERSRSAQGLLGVHVRTAVDQNLDRVYVPSSGRGHQRSPAQGKLFIGIGAGLDQRGEDGCIAVNPGKPHRRGPVVIGGLRIGARRQQQVHHFFVGTVHSPVERRGAIALGSIHVGMLLHQLLYFHPVAAHRSVCNVGMRRGAKAHGRQQQEHRPTDHDPFHMRPLTESQGGLLLSPMES